MSDEMVRFLQQLVNSLSLSSSFILVGLGITLIFGLSRVINFAHGQFMVLGGFLAYAMVESGVPFLLAALIFAPFLVGVVGVFFDLTLFRKHLDSPLANFIISLGLVIALQAAFVEIWGVQQQFQVKSSLPGTWAIGGVRITNERALMFGATAVAVASLFVLLRRTDLGRSMRAVAENRDAASLVGVHVGRSISLSFFLGSAMAGLAGSLLFAIIPFTAFSGGSIVIKGLAVALVGGLGSVEGAVVVGLALGFVETIGTAYGVPGQQWRDGYAFLLMIAILVWRPAGLFRGVGGGTGRGGRG